MAGPRKGFLLRLPPDLLEQLRGWAEQDMRSLNGQIEWLLRDAIRRRLRDPGPDPDPETGPGDGSGSTP